MLRLSVIRENLPTSSSLNTSRDSTSTYSSSVDEACRQRLLADSKFIESGGLSSSAGANAQQQHLHGISNKTEWFDSPAHAWTVESVPKNTRFDDVGTSQMNASSNVNNNASVTSSSAAPFRSGSSYNNNNNNKNIHSEAASAKKYVALCLGTTFTREMCERPSSSLPVQVLKRMRAGGSHTMSILCNVSAIISQPFHQNQITMKDLTEQLLPEEVIAEAALFSSSSNNNNNNNNSSSTEVAGQLHVDPNDDIPPFLEKNTDTSFLGCRLLGFPSDQFEFVRCGADSYGGVHHNGNNNQRGETTKNLLRGANMNQQMADAALIETLIESLAESGSFYNAMGRTSIVFSFFDEHTQAASQLWFLSDAQLPLFGSGDDSNGSILLPGIWKLMQGSMSIVRSLTQETVLFAHSSLIAAADQFDRILNVTVAAATITDRDGAGEFASATATPQDPQQKRTQLLQLRQQQEKILRQMQGQFNQGGSSVDKLAAERQYQRLLVGEIDLLERRIEEVKTLTDQERIIAKELEMKQEVIAQRVKELEDQKKNLVTESRSLNEENRSNAAVGEALHHQIQMLEQRLAAASSSIVAHRQHQTELRRKLTHNDGSDSKSALERQLITKHEYAVADAQKHFAQIQQKIADDAKDAEDQFNIDMRTVQAELSSLQTQSENDGKKLGEMRASWKANENLRESLEKEYQNLRDAMNTLMQNNPELASGTPGSILDERRDKLQRSVAEYKQQISELKIKREVAQNRRETVEENVLASERFLQKSIATLQLRIPPQLEGQREHLCDEETCLRRAVELDFESSMHELQSLSYINLFERVHNANSRRHHKRHEELKLEIQVAEENMRESEEKLRQAEASSNVFAHRIDQCGKEQDRLRDEHRKTVIELQHQLITAESEPVEEAVRREMKNLQTKINSTNAEIELIQGAMMKTPGFNKTTSNSLSTAGSYVGASIAQASLAGSAATFAAHRTLRAAAPVAAELRQRLKQLRRDSYKRQRIENAKAAELEQRLNARRSELNEKATLISTMRSAINELHEQLQLRTVQSEERRTELDQLKRSEESVIKDLEEELEYSREIGARHKTENRLQLTRVTQVMQEHEQELARSRNQIAKLERQRNEMLRKMSDSNEATLMMELQHEQHKRDELREELAKAGVAASPTMHPRSMSENSYSSFYDEDVDYGDEEEGIQNDYNAGDDGVNNSYSYGSNRSASRHQQNQHQQQQFHNAQYFGTTPR